MPQAITLNAEEAVRKRYSRAARAKERDLCCPVSYDPRYLEVIPAEILERDYGCGDPSQFLRPGDVVLDLGSGAGKTCYIAAQIVGPTGKVIGVDFNPEMLALGRKHQSAIAAKLGYDNVVFHRAYIQDLALPLDEVEACLKTRPVRTTEQLAEFEIFAQRLRASAPVVPDESADVVISSCVLNLVPDADKPRLFSEMYRVTKRAGRVAISDIVSDEDVPTEMKNDPKLWSGCLAGALREDEFLEAFERAGFYGIRLARRDQEPWRTVRGIQFRSVTVTAHKGKDGPCLERRQAVIYQGPWKEVRDDDGHVLHRGRRMAVCDKTYQILTRPPYAGDIIPVPPLRDVALSKARKFACHGASLRDPRETKGRRYRKTTGPGSGQCGPGNCC
jgi:arsenite methyltransferase